MLGTVLLYASLQASLLAILAFELQSKVVKRLANRLELQCLNLTADANVPEAMYAKLICQVVCSKAVPAPSG